jgi:hypothetical protein
MLQTTRGAEDLANILVGATLTGTWALIGLRVLAAEEPISVRGLVASLAFAVAGIGAGTLLARFAARYARRRGRAVPAPGSENMALFFLLMGLVNVGWGMEPALQPGPAGWAWLSLLFSVAGGAFIGFALVLGGRAQAERLAPSSSELKPG